MEASRSQKKGINYIADDANSDKWAWVLFEITADILHSTEIIAKAVCFIFSPSCP
jgi:sulfite oxidase